MSKSFMATSFALAVLLGLVLSSESQAYGPWYGSGLWGYGINYYEPSDMQPPYFAVHPPVYYSYPVPRTYGYSPFAYPPYVLTPNPRWDRPLSVSNPYVTLEVKPKPKNTADKTASTTRSAKPLVVENPFFREAASVAKN